MSDPSEKQAREPGKMTPAERAKFEDRIADLESKLGKVRAQRQTEAHADVDAEMRGRGMAFGMQMATGLVAAVIVGAVIGWGLDWFFGTRPWLTLFFFLLGFAAGILNLMRDYGRMQREFTARTGGSIGHKVPDEDDD